MNSFRFLVIGAGAIGCFVGGMLAVAGRDVTLVGRARTAAAVRAKGLELHAAHGEAHSVRSVSAVASVQEAFHGETSEDRSRLQLDSAHAASSFDLIILAVKSYDTTNALDELAAARGLRTSQAPAERRAGSGVALPPVILSLQNGVGNEEEIAARFGPQRVIAGTITAPVEVREPGVVQVTKPSFAIGLAENRTEEDLRNSQLGSGRPSRSSLLNSLSSHFIAAGIPTKVYEDAQGMKWSKLLMNMIGNATSAILGEPPGVTFADPRIANLEIDALREALRVMAAANIRPLRVDKYPLDALAPLLRFGPRPLLRPALHRIVGGARGGKMPSLFLDLEAGKSGSEVSWYNGAIVRKGDEVGVDTPVNRLLTQTVQQLAAEPQLRAAWRGNSERLGTASSGF